MIWEEVVSLPTVITEEVHGPITADSYPTLYGKPGLGQCRAVDCRAKRWKKSRYLIIL